MELDTLSIRVFVVIQELGYLLEYYTCHTSTSSRNFLALSLYLHQQESQIGVGHGVYSSGLLDFHNPYNGTYYAVCVPPKIKTNLIVAQFTNSAVIIFCDCDNTTCNCSSHLKQLFCSQARHFKCSTSRSASLYVYAIVQLSTNHRIIYDLKATCLYC